MKGKRKATAGENLSMDDSMDATKCIEGTQVQEENAGEEKVREHDFSGENREEEEEEGEEEEGEEEDDNDEEEGKGDGEEEEEEEEEEERPKLDEGFFEIEAIRHKRVRKGQLQYLIKWRGWPETSNTWEPLENLQSCSDVIDAYEESLRSGKSSRKRKRKYGGLHTQLKKKQSRFFASDNVMDVKISVIDTPLSSVPLNNSSLPDLPASIQCTGSGCREINADVTNVKIVKQANENGSMICSKQIVAREEDNEYDPKLSELRGAVSTNDVNADKLTVQFQDSRPSQGGATVNVLPKVDNVEPVRNNHHTGAKRRKSGSVKRFKKDLALSEPLPMPNSSHVCSGYVGVSAPLEIGNMSLSVSNPTYNSMGESSINASAITKIIKPISYTASVAGGVQEVLVNFVALRADGKEVVLSNRDLKDRNPLLLISFYEQHLKYGN